MSDKTERFRVYNMGDILQNDLLDLFEDIYDEEEDAIDEMTEVATRAYMENLKEGQDEDTQGQIDLCLRVALNAISEGDFDFAAWVVFSVKDGLLKRKKK